MGCVVVTRRVGASPPRARLWRPRKHPPGEGSYDVVIELDTGEVAVWPLVAVAITWKV